jgi:hypothetical protein
VENVLDSFCFRGVQGIVLAIQQFGAGVEAVGRYLQAVVRPRFLIKFAGRHDGWCRQAVLSTEKEERAILRVSIRHHQCGAWHSSDCPKERRFCDLPPRTDERVRSVPSVGRSDD